MVGVAVAASVYTRGGEIHQDKTRATAAAFTRFHRGCYTVQGGAERCEKRRDATAAETIP